MVTALYTPPRMPLGTHSEVEVETVFQGGLQEPKSREVPTLAVICEQMAAAAPLLMPLGRSAIKQTLHGKTRIQTPLPKPSSDLRGCFCWVHVYNSPAGVPPPFGGQYMCRKSQQHDMNNSAQNSEQQSTGKAKKHENSAQNKFYRLSMRTLLRRAV